MRRRNCKQAFDVIRFILWTFYPVKSLSTLIFNLYFLFNFVSNPTVPTFYHFWPFSLAFFPLCFDFYSNETVHCYNDEFIFIIYEIPGSKGDGDRNTQSRSNIAWIFLWIFDRRDNKLFCFEGKYFDPLDVFGFVDQFDLSFIDMICFIVGK